MGMFDTYENFEDAFKPGDRFTLLAAKLGAMMNTVHGQAQQVLFKIATATNPEGEVFSAFGAGFVAQVQRAERGDFPMEVEFTAQPPKKAGNSPTKILWPADRPKPWTVTGAPSGATPTAVPDDEIPF